MKFWFPLVLTLLWNACLSQSIDIDYFGRFNKSNNFASEDSLILSLKSDFSFTLEFNDPYVCAAYTDSKRFCTGTYSKRGDTLSLKSKSSESNFYIMQESNVENVHSDSIFIILSPSKSVHLKGPRLYVSVNSVPIGEYQIGDTITIDKATSDIRIFSKCLYDMYWKITLNGSYKPRVYHLQLNLKAAEENLSLENIKFLLKDGELLMMEDFYFIDILENRLKEKQPPIIKP
ncbi:hypothetical protein [Brumimicrobium mesophilum]|uniref:hypothetical protein n=1 Tax=Brumimicrobium mesophilum TaxID=392717 RepID=UPI00131D6E62|nr:hypothetical protein [Brumimicrobium mesophilum]